MEEEKSKYVDILKRVSIFSETDEEFLEDIVERLVVRELQANEVLFNKGDYGDSMYIIVSGKVKVHDEEHVFTELKENSFFGDFSLLDASVRSASVTALEYTKLLKLDQKTFFEIFNSKPEFAKGVLKSIIKRLYDKDQLEAELARKNARIEKQNREIEQKNAELEKLSIVARETTNAVIIADKNGEIEWVNEGFTRISGYTLEEFKSVKGKTLLDASCDEYSRSMIMKCLTEKTPVVYDAPYITKEGEEHWIQTTLTPIVDKSTGELKKIVSIDSDITAIKRAEEQIKRQKEEIETKNKLITDSIRYAQRIQRAILPSKEIINRLIPNSFIFFKPKDIVSGDFYFVEEKFGKIIIAAVDCTGHGVPGAFMSIVGNNLLKRAINEKNLICPAEILNFLNYGIAETLRQTEEETQVKDAMDITICVVDPKTLTMEFAGVHNSMYLIRNNELIEFKSDKHPISEPFNEEFCSYTKQNFQLYENDIIYMFSDGFIDQFGGPDRKKFMSKRFKETLLVIHNKPMEEQNELLQNIFENWRGKIEQYDDVLVIGVKWS